MIASRMSIGAWNEEDAKILKPRKWANNAYTALANLLFNTTSRPVTDTINGYRGITREAWQRLSIDANGYAVEYQISIRALRFGLSIEEFPTHEGDRLGGQSKAASIPVGLALLKTLTSELIQKYFGRV